MTARFMIPLAFLALIAVSLGTMAHQLGRFAAALP